MIAKLIEIKKTTTTRFHWSTCFYCCLVVCMYFIIVASLTGSSAGFFLTSWLICPRVQTRCGRSILQLPGETHLTETRSDDPGVKSSPESHFSSWQKVGDGFIFTATELLTRTTRVDMKWTSQCAHRDRVPDTSQPPGVFPCSLAAVATLMLFDQARRLWNHAWSGEQTGKPLDEAGGSYQEPPVGSELGNLIGEFVFTFRTWYRYEYHDAQLIKRTIWEIHTDHCW